MCFFNFFYFMCFDSICVMEEFCSGSYLWFYCLINCNCECVSLLSQLVFFENVSAFRFSHSFRSYGLGIFTEVTDYGERDLNLDLESSRDDYWLQSVSQNLKQNKTNSVCVKLQNMTLSLGAMCPASCMLATISGKKLKWDDTWQLSPWKKLMYVLFPLKK